VSLAVSFNVNSIIIEQNSSGTPIAITWAEVLHSMNTININKTLRGFGVAFAMVFGLMMFSGTTADAQDRGRDNDRYNQDRQDDRYDNDRYNNGRNYNQGYQKAYQKGYKEGLKQGERDARNRHGNNGGYYGNNGGYYGNNSVLGKIFGRGSYNGRNEQAYDQGYQRGYQEGLSRGRHHNHGNSNGNYGY
jgi:hypothetical protein